MQRMLEDALEQKFGLTITPESRAMDVYVLTAPNGPGSGLHPHMSAARRGAKTLLVSAGSSDGALVADDLGRIIEANARAHELLGFADGELTSVPLRLVLPRGQARQAPPGAERGDGPGATADGSPLQAARAIRKDGTEIPMIIRLGAFATARGTATLIVLIGARVMARPVSRTGTPPTSAAPVEGLDPHATASGTEDRSPEWPRT